MLLTSAEAIRGSVAMVDYAAGAVCLMAGRLRAALCAPRVENLWPGSVPTKLRLVSDLQWKIAMAPA
jgi:hypothetical protein